MGISNSESNANMQNLKNIIRQNIIRLGELKKVREISLRIKAILNSENSEKKTNENESNIEIYSSGENQTDAVDEIASLTDKREVIVDGIKNIDSALRHYSHQLTPQYLSILEKTEKNAKLNQKLPKGNSFPEWAENLHRLLLEQRGVLNYIKETDDANSEMIKKLLGELEERTKNIKNNRILMDKFNHNTDIHAGTLFKKQK